MNSSKKTRIHPMLGPSVLALLFALVTLPMQAQQSKALHREGNTWVEAISGSLPASGTLTVKLGGGNVSVQGGPNQAITYTLKKRARGGESSARHDIEQYRFSAIKSGDVAVIEGVAGSGTSATADLTLQVPRSIEVVKLVTRGGNESVRGIAGRVEVSTAGGNLLLDDIGGSISANTAGGNVEVGNAGGNVVLKSGGGNVQMKNIKGQVVASSGGGNISVGSATQGVTASTGGGGIDVKQCGGELKATTGGGSIELGHVGGSAMLQTGGGSIHLTSATGPVMATTGGGAIELYGLAQGAQVQTGGGQVVAEFLGARGFTGSSVQTPAGDVTIILSPDLKATVRATIDMANSHKIRSDFPELKVTTEGGQYGPKMMYAEGNLNGGGPELRVRTSNGDIEFRRARK